MDSNASTPPNEQADPGVGTPDTQSVNSETPVAPVVPPAPVSETVQPEVAATPAAEAPMSPAPETSSFGPTGADTPQPQVYGAQPLVTPTSGGMGGATVMGGDVMPASPAAQASRPRRKKMLTSVLIAVGALVVIGGGSAAAYFGVIVPNKPANVLMSAFLNTAQQKRVTFTGNLHEQPASGSGVAVKAIYSGQADATAKATSVHLGLTVSGVDFTVDARYVGSDLYVKLGDLKTLVSLLNGFSPEYGQLAQSLSGQLSNKWVKIDSTLLDSAGVSCVTNVNLTLTDKDTQLIKEQYQKHPFLTIKSTSTDTVAGKKVTKYVLSMDDDKAAPFVKQLGSLSVVKALEKCGNSSTDNTFDTSSLADHDHTPLTVWVDKSSNEIVQVASQSTAQDAKKDNLSVNATVTLDYTKPVSISAPADSTPVMQLFSQLQGAFSDSGASFDSESLL